MKIIIKSILLISIFSIIAGHSCSISSNNTDEINICKEWKLAGFGDVSSSGIKNAEPNDEWCYVLKFKERGELAGMTSTNSFEGTYEINYSKSIIQILIGFITKVGEYLDGELYIESLKNVNFFTLEKDELKLYYNDGQNYLLFKSR